MSLTKIRPKSCPTRFFFVDKSSTNIRSTFVMLKKLLKVNNYPMGEFSPNPVTLD
jgi:hypothetical protein